ncbi:unnamed protein product [Lactuca saligna]|uniref:Uncharacterized protein n=1 Tax=Lactuca saligna TaxID=75948 RepID=A0AA36EEK4_LACSI|nr:unnamed protein product [Lactuca saligna]
MLLPSSTILLTYNNILNQPITTIFPSQLTEGEKSIFDKDEDDVMDDTRSYNLVSGIEVDVLLKSQEHRLKYEIIDLHEVENVRHVLFVEEVKKVENSMNLKVESLKSTLLKEVTNFEQSHESLLTKLDVVIEAIHKLVEKFTSFLTKDAQVFTKMKDFSASLKDSISKLESSSKSSIS